MKTYRATPNRAALSSKCVLLAMMTVLLPCLSASGISKPLSVPPYTRVSWKQLQVKIVARGSTATDATGDVDAYLALISEKGGGNQIAARLVHYHPSFDTRRHDELNISGRTLRLRLSSASYCSMPAKDFVVEGILDQDAWSTFHEANDHDSLPCFILRE